MIVKPVKIKIDFDKNILVDDREVNFGIDDSFYVAARVSDLAIFHEIFPKVGTHFDACRPEGM